MDTWENLIFSLKREKKKKEKEKKEEDRERRGEKEIHRIPTLMDCCEKLNF